ncbi:LysR family transcriptional regulator [Marinobacterium sp. D7]|uniref:LysR family transcriptional regulator n=1 Tax=Marinobacterium ramblicola TaxID=2849041 RepID=UPI001C2CF694|nr:LysR family transcriptional regulator [Marinobacterium ramblicola]MBV1790184.1 LysR family transcriptional regulator [Marinobacterium ramblicola]
MFTPQDLQGIPEFLTLIEKGSFTAAAEALGISRSRVSQVIARLESRLGVQLIQRSTRSMHLTEVGEQFHESCRRSFALIDQAIDRAQEEQQRISGTLRINSVGGWFGERILAPQLLEFMQRHPEVNIELDFASAHVDLIADQYDLAVRMGELPDSTLIARPLARYATHVCASPDFIAHHGQPSHPRELGRYPVALGSLNRWRFRHRTDPQQSCEVTLKGHLWCPNGHVTRLAALEGEAIVSLPDFYLADDLRDGRLLPLFDDWYRPDSQVSLVYPRARYRIRRVQALVEFLLDQLQPDRERGIHTDRSSP